jgi:hypothetical protein
MRAAPFTVVTSNSGSAGPYLFTHGGLVSKHEAELRRRLSNGDDVYDTMDWFLKAIDAQAFVDGGPEPDLSWFEREFLGDKANIDRYHEERMRRKTIFDLLNDMATEGPVHPERPHIDMSGAADEDLINKIGDDYYGDSAVEELVKRANAKRITLAHYIGNVVISHKGAGRGR